ncbi:MAG TPA: alpha/beta fold hydrolase [Steroidobacteraceae bacterium]|jgi:pimeloyl-ACP methyl ester carboxylesterase|nr:alpha/beta fold hydrolase [Steroidobacteraceae bacterium]
MPKINQLRMPADAPPRVRRGYFDCRYGQLHVHHVMPPGGGFEEGAPLLCVHDFAGSGRLFTRFMTLSGRERTVYAPDLPGFGESDPPTQQPALADYAAALGDFIDSMRLRQVALLGVRYGALVATELAAMRPTQVSRVALVSVPLLSDTERQQLRNPAPVATPPGEFRAPEWQRWAQEAVGAYALRERLARLVQPVLVLRPRDEFYEATARVREALPSARVMDLEPDGMELFVSAAQRVADALRDFVRV